MCECKMTLFWLRACDSSVYLFCLQLFPFAQAIYSREVKLHFLWGLGILSTPPMAQTAVRNKQRDSDFNTFLKQKGTLTEAIIPVQALS